MSMGNHTALVLNIPDSQSKFVDKLWKKYLSQEGTKVTKNRKSNEWVSEPLYLRGVRNLGSVVLYATSEEIGEDVEHIVWFDLGDTYLNSRSHGSDYLEGEKFLMQFGLFATREMIRLELEAEEKALKEMENKLNRLARQNDGYHREIKMARERIERAEANIVTNEQEQQTTATEIEDQQRRLEAIKQRMREID